MYEFVFLRFVNGFLHAAFLAPAPVRGIGIIELAHGLLLSLLKKFFLEALPFVSAALVLLRQATGVAEAALKALAIFHDPLLQLICPKIQRVIEATRLVPSLQRSLRSLQLR